MGKCHLILAANQVFILSHSDSGEPASLRQEDDFEIIDCSQLAKRLLGIK